MHQQQWSWVILKVTFHVWNLSNSHTSGNLARVDYGMFGRELESILASNFNCLLKTEWLYKVTVSHIHGKSGNISEMEMLLLQITTTTTTTILRPFFQDHPGEPVPGENFWTLWCKGRLAEADTPTNWLGATPTSLISAHLHHPPRSLIGSDVRPIKRWEFWWPWVTFKVMHLIQVF